MNSNSDIELDENGMPIIAFDDRTIANLMYARDTILEKYPTEEDYKSYLYELVTYGELSVEYGVFLKNVKPVQVNALMNFYRFLTKLNGFTEEMFHEAFVPDKMKKMSKGKLLEEALQQKALIEPYLFKDENSADWDLFYSKELLYEECYKPLLEVIKALRTAIKEEEANQSEAEKTKSISSNKDISIRIPSGEAATIKYPRDRDVTIIIHKKESAK